MEQSWLNAIYGGLLIGLSSGLFLLAYGRILGVSGIVGKLAEFPKSDTLWRGIFLFGLVVGGYVASQLWPENFNVIRESTGPYARYALAGLLVGFGTRLGNGCTSGHGVCGIGRLSPRGIFATITFIATGMLTVAIIGR